MLLGAFSLSALVEIRDLRLGLSSCTTIFWLWFSLAISSTLTFTSFVRFPYDHPSGERALFFLYYGFVVAQLFLASWAGPAPSHVQFKGNQV